MKKQQAIEILLSERFCASNTAGAREKVKAYDMALDSLKGIRPKTEKLDDKKDIKEAINQLENLRFHYEELIKIEEVEAWKRDIKALDLAIEVLKSELQITRENIEVVKVNKSYKQLICNDIDIDEYKKFAQRVVIDMLKTDLFVKDLIKVTCLERDKDYKEIEVIAELDVVKREV